MDIMAGGYIYTIYAVEDSERALATVDLLRGNGVDCRDRGADGLAVELYPKTAPRLIAESRCVILFLSRHTQESQTAMRELSHAIALGKRVITIYLEPLESPSEVSYYISAVTSFKADDAELTERLLDFNEVRACMTSKSDSEAQRCACAYDESDRMDEVFGERSRIELERASMELDQRKQSSACVIPPEAFRCGDELPKPCYDSSKSFAVEPERTAPALRKKSFGEKLKGIFGNKTDEITFSVLAPERIEKDEYTVIDFYAFEEEYRHIVEQAKVERAKRDGGVTEIDGGLLRIKRGTEISVLLESPDIEIKNNIESRVWSGKYQRFNFSLLVPRDYPRNAILFTATVYFGSVIATRISFTLHCQSFGFQRPNLARKDVRSAFISYASADRERVAAILQGMRRVRPDMDIFFDVETLKSGEDWENVLSKEIDKRDVLYLCWSLYAKASPWVEREWRYALAQKGLDGIEPIPLVLPKDCPPPEELKSKHFGAKELYYK